MSTIVDKVSTIVDKVSTELDNVSILLDNLGSDKYPAVKASRGRKKKKK